MKFRTRRRIISAVVCAAILAFFGCGPKILVRPEPAGQGEAVFSKAEAHYGAGRYDQALEEYLAFLQAFPASSLAPAALMKTAAIYERKEDYLSAQRAYSRVMTNYAETVYAPDAAVALLALLYRQGKYAELIQESAQLPKTDFSPSHIMQISILAGDAFMAIEAPVEAAYAYISAHAAAPGADDEKAVLPRLKQAISLLDENDVRMLTMRLKDHRDVRLVHTIREQALFLPDTIGCMLPLSGTYAVFGNRALRGIELALNQIAVQEGVDFKIIVKDTRSDPDTAKRAVRELVARKAACIIGPIACAPAAAAAAQENRIPLIALSQMDGIPETGNYVFRNFITPQMQIKTLVAYAVDHLYARRFAILYPSEKYGVTFMNLFWDEVIRQGGEVVGVESYGLEQTDFEAPVKKLVGLYYDIPEDLKKFALPPREVETGQEDTEVSEGLENGNDAGGSGEDEEPQPIVDFDFLFLPDSPKKAGLIIPQLAYHDVRNVTLGGTNLWHSDDLIQMAGTYAQGAVIIDGFFKDSDAPPVKLFVREYEKVYDEPPGFIEAIAYDSAMMLFSRLAGNPVTLRSDIQRALIDMPYFDGVTGLTAFNETGEADKRLYILEIVRNRFVERHY